MADARNSFHHQLEELRHDIVLLAAKVTEAIPRGTEALLAFDLRAGQALIDDDDELDSLALDVEERCYTLMVRQQPVASDMRAIVTAIRLTAEIERSGDLVVNVAKAARRMYGAELPARVRGLIQAMGEQAARLFTLAIDAYADGDADLAAALDDIDDHLDALHKGYIAAIIERDEHVETATAVQLALIGRYYERIGDHAVNIGERVRYMVNGWLPEHTGAARLAARRRREAVGGADGGEGAAPAGGNGPGGPAPGGG